MVIIWILAVVLTESYITISKTALRIEQEKNISEEALVLTQIFQSIADETTIDYSGYNNNELESNSWYYDVLYLKWSEWITYKIYTTGNCLELEWNFEFDDDGNEKPDENWEFKDIGEYQDCKLILEDNDGDTVLNTSGKVIVSKAKFRIIPYYSNKYYFDSGEETIVDKLHQPAFWMFIHLYSPLYQAKWAIKTNQTLQLFFNLKNIKWQE